jgi:hypothetical protein
MTKAKARARAKAKATEKAKKRQVQADEPVRAGHFDPGPNSIKGPTASASVRNYGGSRRGAARSR